MELSVSFRITKSRKIPKRIKILTQLTAIAKNNITLDSDYDFILPLPGHPKNLKTRDYSPTYIIAKNLKLNSCINSNILNHSGIGEIQSLSDQKNRIDNACKNFSINFNKMILGSSLLLVDDVITTGASVEVISRLLLEAGANRIDVFCLAHSTKFITQTGETDDNRQNL